MKIVKHSKVSQHRWYPGLLFFALLSLALSACGPVTNANWTRRDMPTDGLESVVTYNQKGPASSDQLDNWAELRGVNQFAPTLQQRVTFSQMSGTKNQDVQITLPDGTVYQALGMNKIKRYAGATNYMTLEPATYTQVDAKGNVFCGAKVRLDFNRNLGHYLNPDQRDYQSLWYYDIPCVRQGNSISLDPDKAKLRAVVLNEVWQFRLGGKPEFFNWGHSVTIVGGLPAQVPGSWWTHWDLPNTDNDAYGVANMVNRMVNDLTSSNMPWLEFNQGGDFKDTYLIYSAGDADTYASFDRIFLNRQSEYNVFYRPNRSSPWDYIRIQPLYNTEWNDIGQVFSTLKSFALGDHLNNGIPKDDNDQALKEWERSGFANAPNVDLDQIRWLDSSDNLLYSMTVRAFYGATDSFIFFGRGTPDFKSAYAQGTSTTDTPPRPVIYDDKGNPQPEEKQPTTPKQWAEWSREASFWNYLKDNPKALGAEYEMQYRFTDNSTWQQVICGSGDSTRVCGYSPVTWDLSASYYTKGDPKNAWLALQTLGEVGVRTLGVSYVSGRYEGTGIMFAMAQQVYRDEFFKGFSQESLYIFDSRAAQLPDRLAQAWPVLRGR